MFKESFILHNLVQLRQYLKLQKTTQIINNKWIWERERERERERGEQKEREREKWLTWHNDGFFLGNSCFQDLWNLSAQCPIFRLIVSLCGQYSLHIVKSFLKFILWNIFGRLGGQIAECSKSILRSWSGPGGREFKSRRPRQIY